MVLHSLKELSSGNEVKKVKEVKDDAAGVRKLTLALRVMASRQNNKLLYQLIENNTLSNHEYLDHYDRLVRMVESVGSGEIIPESTTTNEQGTYCITSSAVVVVIGHHDTVTTIVPWDGMRMQKCFSKFFDKYPAYEYLKEKAWNNQKWNPSPCSWEKYGM